MGCLITFEGVNGSGKTTVINLLIEKLRFGYKEYEFNIFNYRCPGSGIPEIRDIFKNPKNEFSGITDLFLACSDQHELFVKHIIPKLEEPNTLILVDRLFDSTFAYQKVFGKVDESLISIFSSVSTCDINPNLTLILDLDYEVSHERRKDENFLDRFEKDFEKKFNKLRKAYLNRKNHDPSRIKIINSNVSLDQLVSNCYFHIVEVINRTITF